MENQGYFLFLDKGKNATTQFWVLACKITSLFQQPILIKTFVKNLFGKTDACVNFSK